MPSNEASNCWVPSVVLSDRSVRSVPRTSVQLSTCTGDRRVNLPVRSRTASRVTTQSRVLVRSIAASMTVAADAVVAILTFLSISCAITSTSVRRCSNLRRLTEPVDKATACDSSEVTLSIGTKIGRRVGSSTTMPSTRGGFRSRRRAATMSLTLPMDSPPGPKTGSPTSWATKTRGVPATCSD